MEEAVARVTMQASRLGREAGAWPVWAWLSGVLEAFKKMLPLITDLRNPAMRPRHWQQLMERVGARFDPASPAFTLESVVALRLDQHVDFVAELSVTASKEQGIEANLAAIGATWAGLALDMAEYKGTFKLRSAEDVFAALEDNGVTLSTMKGSRWHAVFADKLARWERTLALASEAVEMVLQVQRAWMYLESIFVGSEDIRRQLPAESAMFEGVHAAFSAHMAELQRVGNVVAATTAPGVLAAFQVRPTGDACWRALAATRPDVLVCECR